MKTSLVTGGAGFLGSHLATSLLQLGHKVVVLDDLSGGLEENVPQGAVFVKGSILNVKLLEKLFAEHKFNYVYHLAAYAAEGLSHFIKRFNYQNNLIASVNLINASVNHGVECFIFTSCHDQETRLVTQRGLVRYTEVRRDDVVLSLNPNTHQVEESPILKIITSDFDGDMVSISGRRTQALLTSNHRVLIQMHRSKSFKMIEASELLSRSVTRIPIGTRLPEMTSDEIHRFEPGSFHWNNKQPVEINKSDLLYLIGLYIADGSLRKGMLKARISAKDYIKSNRDILGKFSQLRAIRNHTRPDSDIMFCVPKADKARNKLESVLTRNSIRWNGHATGVRIHHAGLRAIFSECGSSAFTKKISTWALSQSASLLSHLFNGLMDGDGSVTKQSYTTISPTLKDQFIYLAFRLGLCASLRSYPPQCTLLKDGRSIQGRYEVFRVGVSTTTPFLTRRNISKQRYAGPVWCLEVPHGNFLVERNGKYHFSGNSIAVYGAAQAPMREDMWPQPEDSYGIAKFAVEQELRASHQMFGLEHIIFRPHNVFGPRQNIADKYRNVVGIFMNQLLKGEPMTIFGDGEQQRAFSYVDDIIPIMARAVDKPEARQQVFNIGADQVVSVNQLSALIAHEMGVGPLRMYLKPRKEVKVAFSDHAKVKSFFGEGPSTPLWEGIRQMAAWVKTHGAKPGKPFAEIEIQKNLPESWVETCQKP